jgi:tripartite-type tricarboxylate transporter receptor subunit TctC
MNKNSVKRLFSWPHGRITSISLLLSILVLGGTPFSSAFADEPWPTRPITLIVPFEPGASIDLIMRFYAQRLGKALGQNIIVENYGGAGGAIGMQRAARAAPDGYTLLGTPVTVISAIPHQMKLGFDPLTKFVPIARIAETVPVFGVPTSLGIDNMAQFIAAARKSPGTLSYASAGVGSILHVRFEALTEAANINLVHIPYKGGSTWVADFRGGRVSLAGDGTVLEPMVKQGTAKALAVVDTVRAPSLPDVPTIKEVLPNYQIPPGWNLFLAPAGTPQPVIDRVAMELKKIAAQPASRQELGQFMVRPIVDPPGTDLRKMVADTDSYYIAMFKRLHITQQ